MFCIFSTILNAFSRNTLPEFVLPGKSLEKVCDVEANLYLILLINIS